MNKKAEVKIKLVCSSAAAFVACCAFAFGYESTEKKVSHIMGGFKCQITCCCEKNADVIDDDKCRSYKCNELDELGGQPVISAQISAEADKWIADNFSALPKGYLKTIPKTNLLIDRQKKERQDCVLAVVEELRKVIRYAYCQVEAFQLPKDKFKEIASLYKKLMQMSEWRKIGDRQPGVALKAADSLGQMITEIHLINVSIYDQVLVEKQRKHATFANAHPETVQTGLALRRAKNAEARAFAAEMKAAEAEEKAQRAEASAAMAASEAWEAQERATAAERKATFGY